MHIAWVSRLCFRDVRRGTSAARPCAWNYSLVSYEIGVSLFQVCAAAIPTLLIATAVTLKRGHILAKETAKPLLRGFHFHSMFVLTILVANAEINALLAVGRGGGSRIQAFWVVLGLVLVLYQVLPNSSCPL